MSELALRLRQVEARILAACDRARRDPASVRMVAVSKTVTASIVREAVEAGQSVFGENRVQEALPKIAAVGTQARWHLVGHLQSNKARQAVGAFELIHGVDSVSLAEALERRAAARSVRQAVLVQANLAQEPTKHGAPEAGLFSLLGAAARLAHLDLRGLMIIPPPSTDAEGSRPWFRALRQLRDRASAELRLALPELSMGMTDDFEVAIEEGATLVRIGRAIFGERT